MSTPQRIQLSRKKGFNLQRTSMALNGLPAVNCARPSKYGNPFSVENNGRVQAVKLFRASVDKGMWRIMIKRELRGKNLACYCDPTDGLPCHADELLKIANA